MKLALVWGAAILPATPFLAHAASEENVAEVMLISNLDESRGYCLDIAGGQGKQAPVERGLQAHTCYNYTGGILEDQGFDIQLISQGAFRIIYFDVCMTALLEEGAAISLEECNSSDNQNFLLKANGHISPAQNSSLCLTVDSDNKREGRGGSPAHVMRPVSLQLCDDSKNDYQRWTLKPL